MAETFKPETADQVREFVAWAAAERTPIEIVGNGSKRALGRPGNADHVLSLSAFSGISLYEPEELVLSAGPGTPMSAITEALSAARQELAFEPPDYGPLLGGAANEGTLAGAIACNLSGPRRIKAGAARDHFLGVSAVSGRGEVYSFVIDRRLLVPGFDEPYAVAQVNPVESDDDAVRITANLVECELDAIEIGMPVEVVFVDRSKCDFDRWGSSCAHTHSSPHAPREGTSSRGA